MILPWYIHCLQTKSEDKGRGAGEGAARSNHNSSDLNGTDNGNNGAAGAAAAAIQQLQLPPGTVMVDPTSGQLIYVQQQVCGTKISDRFINELGDVYNAMRT